MVTSPPRRIFWSGARNLTHVVYAASWLRAQLANDSPAITLVAMDHGNCPSRNGLNASDIISLLPTHPSLHLVSVDEVGLRADRSEILTYLAVGAPGIKPWLRLKREHKTRRIDVVATDEGIGSYGTWQTRQAAYLRQGGRRGWSSIRAVAVDSASSVLTTERWPLYLRTESGWGLNTAVADEFRRATRQQHNRRAIFLPQPWVEMGVLDGSCYHRHVQQIARASSEAGFQFAVRPHPAENSARYEEWDVLAGSTPAELDPRVTSASVVIGATSTALVNLASIFAIPALRLVAPGMEHLEQGLSVGQASLLDAFVPELVDEITLRDALSAKLR